VPGMRAFFIVILRFREVSREINDD